MLFPKADSKSDMETNTTFTPNFNSAGLLPAVVTDAGTGELLMVAYMNGEAIMKTLETGFAHFYSRSRKSLWKKGESSGHELELVDLRTDCDQDTLWLLVNMKGPGACHVGYRSCFYRSLKTISDGNKPESDGPTEGPVQLEFVLSSKAFDPDQTYKK